MISGKEHMMIMTGRSFGSQLSSDFFSARKHSLREWIIYYKPLIIHLTPCYGLLLPILPLFLLPLTPQPQTSSPITIVTPVTPLYRFGVERFVNKPRIFRSVSSFHDAISWNPDTFNIYSNTNSNTACRFDTLPRAHTTRWIHLQLVKRLKDQG